MTSSSVFGTFVHIRTYLGGEGVPALVIEPDTQIGFVEPLGEGVSRRSAARSGRARSSTGSSSSRAGRGASGWPTGGPPCRGHVATAVGNTRLPALFDALPPERRSRSRRRPRTGHTQLMVLTLLERPVLDLEGYLIVQDPTTGSNVWGVPLHAIGTVELARRPPARAPVVGRLGRA